MKRHIAFDLDDTLLGSYFEMEYPSAKWLFKLLGYEPFRIGTKELLQQLQQTGWTISVYTSSYRSLWYMRRLFWWYGIRLQKVINAEVHLKKVRAMSIRCEKYPPAFDIDILVDNSRGVALGGRQYGFKVLLLSPEDEDWTNTVLKKLNEI